MLPIELDNLNKHQLKEIRLLPQLRHHRPRCIMDKFLRSFPFRRQYERQDLFVWMFIQDDGRENILFTGKMVVDPSQRQSGPVGDLPHRSGVKAMFHEQTERSIFNCESRAFRFGKYFFSHIFSLLEMKPSVYVFSAKNLLAVL